MIEKKNLFAYGGILVDEYKKALSIGINQENAKTKLDVFLNCVFMAGLSREFDDYLKEVI